MAPVVDRGIRKQRKSQLKDIRNDLQLRDVINAKCFDAVLSIARRKVAQRWRTDQNKPFILILYLPFAFL